MDKIPSFNIDHETMLRGIYVSRKDQIGEGVVTTFDIRMKEPNREPVMDTAVMHTFEHLGATFLRNHPQWKDKTIYFGPMGCRTGHYLLLKGDLKSQDIVDLITEMCVWIVDFQGDIPGAAPRDCGNWLDHNLGICQWEGRKFLSEVLTSLGPENLNYPG